MTGFVYSEWDRLSVVTSPTVLPISVSECKTFLRVNGHYEDQLIRRFIESAVSMIDGVNGIGYALMRQQWRVGSDTRLFGMNPDWVELPGTPIRSTDNVTLGYTDGSGTSQTVTLSDWYDAGVVSDKPVIRKPTNWPIDHDSTEPITIEYWLGETDPDNLPADLLQSIRFIVCSMYEKRDSIEGVSDMRNMPIGKALNRYRQSWV